MDFILDNPETEQKFQQIIVLIKSYKNGEIADMMKQKGLGYKQIWGASVIDLREIARRFEPDHLLALKLWNKQWRETMILATLLDEPALITEEQMDFWTKSFDNTEIAEQASANLWVKTKFAFVKSLEWCRGKKHLIRFTGIHLMGRLAISSNSAINEMFEPFFGELHTLAKDAQLNTVLYRTVVALGSRSTGLNIQCIELARLLKENANENAAKLGADLFSELTSDYFQDAIKNKKA
jgi:hypothetical protein